MATEYASGSETVGGTEWSLTTDTSGPDADTTAGTYMLVLNLSALLAGDEFELKLYEKVTSGGSQLAAPPWRFVGVQPGGGIAFIPAIVLMHGWDFTLKKIAGTDRAITWSIRKP
jgi:hypothetical protein